MFKVIFEGDAEDIYHQTTFSAFMNELIAKKEVCEVYTSINRLGPKVYHFTGYGLTLSYLAEAVLDNSQTKIKSEIKVWGSRKGISDVEKIILAKQEELKSLSSTQKA